MYKRKRANRLHLIVLLVLIMVFALNSTFCWKAKATSYIKNNLKGDIVITSCNRVSGKVYLEAKTNDNNEIIFEIVGEWKGLKRAFRNNLDTEITALVEDGGDPIYVSCQTSNTVTAIVKNKLAKAKDLYLKYGITKDPVISLNIKYKGLSKVLEWSYADKAEDIELEIHESLGVPMAIF